MVLSFRLSLMFPDHGIYRQKGGLAQQEGQTDGTDTEKNTQLRTHVHRYTKSQTDKIN
jgi:hypothetical protein